MPLVSLVRAAAFLMAGVLSGVFATASIAASRAELIEGCSQIDDAWRRIDVCSAAIESGYWPGGRASWAHSNRAVAYAELGDYISAFDDHERAVALDSTNATARNNKANSHADFREYDRALDEYANAIRLRPGYLNAHFNRAGVLMSLGRYDEARQDYDAVLAAEPDIGEAYAGRADAHCAAGDVAASIADREAAIGTGVLAQADFVAYLSEKGYAARADASDEIDDELFLKALTDWTAAGCP